MAVRTYFRQLPDFNYVNLDSNLSSEYTRVKNLFKRGELRSDIFVNLAFFNKYSIVGEESPDEVSLKLYGTEEYDWVILLTNNIINVRDEWPLSNDSLYNYLIDVYGSEENLQKIHHHETIEVKDDSGRVVLRKGLRTEEMYSFTYYERSTQQNVTVSNASEAISNYVDAIRKEEAKRNIFVLKPEYLNVLTNDIERIMQYKEGGEQYVSPTLKQGDNIKLFS
tara:strand:+ start:424 stop:1092 length:669 start_codon:yes stop_codon:yes gene_type:complete